MSLVPGPPRLMGYKNISARSIEVIWLPPVNENGIILYYNLTATPVNGVRELPIQGVDGNERSFTFQQLGINIFLII